MKVAVVGPGAMGCLFAAYLANSDIKTYLVDYKNDRATRLNESGLTVEENGQSIHAKVEVVTAVPAGIDLVIVLTKAYATSALRFPPETPVLTLQNGLGNVETLCSMIGSARILVGVTSEGCTLLDEGHVRHAGRGLTHVGAWTSCPVDPVVEVLSKAGFNVEPTESPGQLIWEKVAINAGINPLTAVLNVPNGALIEIKEVRQLMRDLVVEAAKVAATEGYRFQQSLVEEAEVICQRTSTNISSMLQDIRAGKATEINAISGEIIRRAQLASLPTPRTRVIYQLIRGLEQH
ncbi:MAG: ketopantoate reductase family protein [Candidatus Hydrogenedentota bacterium]